MPEPQVPPPTGDVEFECQESSSLTFEWTLRGLKNLFDSTKGESKSKVTKSAKFGGGRWQILFYANGGLNKEGDGGFVSLYLSCEPTAEEKEAALADSGKWVRDGAYKFTFELRNVGKNILYNQKEAPLHSFQYKTANWGWAQFARRDNVYYQSITAKTQDAFVIICTITSAPTPPPPAPPIPRQSVPKTLLDTVGALLDNPAYSDVKFIIPKHRGRGDARTIWASKVLLQRAEYFYEMFTSGFAEGLSEALTLPSRSSESFPANTSYVESSTIIDDFEDSDAEDSENEDFVTSTGDYFPESSNVVNEQATPVAETNTGEIDGEVYDDMPHPRSVKDATPLGSIGSSKMTIVVRDVAYTTYRAILYYIYTDNIVFAPLSSSFISTGAYLPGTPSTIPSTPSEVQGQASNLQSVSLTETKSTRSAWITDWMNNNPGRPAPCSAKAAYRVADRLDLPELKERAAQHIFKSLTVDNIAYEVFSPFAAAFEEIRKVEITFFLDHWHKIRTSEAMRSVWQQIRSGRHPGFEEVWPLIAQSLEFKPSVVPVRTVIPKAADNAIQGSIV